MGRKLILLLLLMAFFFQTGATCKGTETGNPQSTNNGNGDSDSGDAEESPVSDADSGSSEAQYTNSSYGVEAEYFSAWSVTEAEVPSASGAVESCLDCPAAMPAPGIDTFMAASTVFTDETTTVTLYYVVLDSEPESLLGYLEGVFSDRSFESFMNSAGLEGYFYDGDPQEYYFLQGTLLLYVVADISEDNDGRANFEVLIDSLRFE